MHTERISSALLAFAFALAIHVPDARAHDHAPYQRVLSSHAHEGGVDYAALARDAAARADLDRYVASLATMPASSGLADWLNAYNAIVIHRIVQHWPIASVRDVPGFFDGAVTPVAGENRTLDDLEHRVIRARFRDARVHLALNCGAISCPPLPSRAFEARTLSSTLDRLARAAVSSDAFVRVEGQRLRVSEIFFWFQQDFDRDAGSVLAWLKRYDATGRLDPIPAGAALERIPYRWTVNHRPR